MKSTWIEPATGKTLTPIPFTLVIKQSFLSISCTIYTKESSSASYSAEILIDKEAKRKQHLHVYREGYGDKWAIPVPPERFPDILDLWQLLQDFMRFCNITEPPFIEKGLFS